MRFAVQYDLKTFPQAQAAAAVLHKEI